MSVVWSCNEWDQLEEVIVGNPLRAKFPTADPSTQLAESSYWHPRIFGVASVRYTPIPATQMVISGLN